MANLTLIKSDDQVVYRAELHGNLFVPNVASLGKTLVANSISVSHAKVSMKLIPNFLEVSLSHANSDKPHIELVPLTSVFSMSMTPVKL